MRIALGLAIWPGRTSALPLVLTFSPDLHSLFVRHGQSGSYATTVYPAPNSKLDQTRPGDCNNESISRGRLRHDSPSPSTPTLANSASLQSVRRPTVEVIHLNQDLDDLGLSRVKWPNTSTAKEPAFGSPTRSKVGYPPKSRRPLEVQATLSSLPSWMNVAKCGEITSPALRTRYLTLFPTGNHHRYHRKRHQRRKRTLTSIEKSASPRDGR